MARPVSALARMRGYATATSSSTWCRPPRKHPAGQVYVFRLGDGSMRWRPLAVPSAAHAEPDKRWFLHNYAESVFTPDRDREEPAPVAGLEGINPDLLGLTVVRDETMTGAVLWRYVQYLKRNGLNAREYEVAFWSRIAPIFAVPLMCVLAVPFVLGPLRAPVDRVRGWWSASVSA